MQTTASVRVADISGIPSERTRSDRGHYALFNAAINEIANELLGSATQDAAGDLTWGRGFTYHEMPVQDGGLFNGRVGNALFLAAAAKSLNRVDLADAAASCCGRLRRSLDDTTLARSIVDESILGLAGLGGILYGLTHIGGWIGRPDLIDAAANLASLVTPLVLDADNRLDIFWGMGGLLPGLMAVEASGHASSLQSAIRAGDLLVARRVVDRRSGYRAWRTAGEQPWAGFAHGSAGIAASLLSLYQRTRVTEYAEAAFDAFAFERAIPRVSGGWPDEYGGESRVSSWCHGAPGIAVSRLAAVELAADMDYPADVLQDIDDTLTSTVEMATRAPDTLCCGSVGRAAVLIRAADVLGNEELRAVAIKALEFVVARVREHGISASPKAVGHVGPGLWQGKAGLGYTLIRSMDSRSWPCLLTLS